MNQQGYLLSNQLPNKLDGCHFIESFIYTSKLNNKNYFQHDVMLGNSLTASTLKTHKHKGSGGTYIKNIEVVKIGTT